MAYALLASGSVLQLQSRGSEARAQYEEALALARTIPQPALIGNALSSLASLELTAGKPAAAEALLREALMVCQDLASRRPGLRCLEVSARWAHAQGRLALAARLFSAVAALRDAGGSSSPVTDAGAPAAPSTRAEEAAAMEAIRAALGEAAFASAWTEGQAMRLEDAIRQALDGLDGV